MRYIRAGNFPFWKHSLTNKLFELLCVSYFSNIQTHPHQLPLQWLKRIFTSFCRWPSSWSSLQVTLMHVSSPTVHLQVNARWCQHWLHLNSTKRLVALPFPISFFDNHHYSSALDAVQLCLVDASALVSAARQWRAAILAVPWRLDVPSKRTAPSCALTLVKLVESMARASAPSMQPAALQVSFRKGNDNCNWHDLFSLDGCFVDKNCTADSSSLESTL